MAVRFIGLNLLKANFYGEISIIQNETGYNVYIKEIQLRTLKKIKGQQNRSAKNKSSIFENVTPAYKSVRNEGDEQRVISVISTFLQYTPIKRIMPRYKCLSDSYDIITGPRKLKLQIDEPLSTPVRQMVFQKYSEDRLKFLARNNHIKNITIMPAGATAYELYKEQCKEEIRLCLLLDLEETAKQEKEFMQRVITDKLNECGEKATFDYGHLPFGLETDEYQPGFAYLTFGNWKIDVYSEKELIEMIEQMVDKHNKEIEQGKRIQLKMEGF